jgi:hypothetical protein
LLQVAQPALRGSFRDLWLRWITATLIGCGISMAVGLIGVWILTVTQPVPLHDSGFYVASDIKPTDRTWRYIWELLNPLSAVWWMFLSALVMTRLQWRAIGLTFPTGLRKKGALTLIRIFNVPIFMLTVGLSVMLQLGSASSAYLTPLGLGLVGGLILGYLQTSFIYNDRVPFSRKVAWIFVCTIALVVSLYAFTLSYLALGGPVDLVSPRDPIHQAGIVLLSGTVVILITQGAIGIASIKSKLESVTV